MVLHHFEYTAEMCACRYCPYYRGKRKCQPKAVPALKNESSSEQQADQRL